MQNLQQGSKGTEVAKLQTALKAAGFDPGKIDSDFGPKTAAALSAYQTSKGLKVDSIFGPQSAGSLYGTQTPATPVASPSIPPTSPATPTPAPVLTYGQAYAGDTVKYDTETGATLKPGQTTLATPAATPIVTNVPPPAVTPPTLPTPTSAPIINTYFESLTAGLENTRKALEESYKKQLEENKAAQAASQAKIDENTAKENTALGEVNTLTQPFRADLETKQREALYVNQNFEANQKLTNELDSLLTEGNALIKQMQGVTGLSAIRTPRINEAIQGVTARVGVIQAVMNARTGQIAEAYRMIDRSVDAINSDSTDKLKYYDALLKFYDSEKTTENTNLTSLKGDEKKYVEAKIVLLQKDLENTQKTADAIKTAMVDPDTAYAYAAAGVTLNDTPQEITKKLSEYSYSKEIADTSKDMAMKGYTAVIPGQSAPKDAEVVTFSDSKGKTKTFWKKPTITGAQTEVRTVAGRQLLIDSRTGATIADIGPAPTPSPSSTNTINKDQFKKAGEQKLNAAKGKDGYTD